jgi:hypothetical protein
MLVHGASPAGQHAASDAVMHLQQTHSALGGATRLARVRSLRATGPFERDLGHGRLRGHLSLTIVWPNQMRKVETISQASRSRITVLSGDTAWDSVEGGEVARAAGPSAVRIDAIRAKMARRELRRWFLAFLARESTAVVGVTSTPQHGVRSIDFRDDEDGIVSLRVSDSAAFPLAVRYRDVLVQPSTGNAEAGTTAHSRWRPRLGTYEIKLLHFGTAAGIKLPRRIETSVAGTTTQVWTIERLELNPAVSADLFARRLEGQ